MLKINSEKELILFLKEVAKNAVSDSKKILEKDPYVSKFKEKERENKSLYEQESEEEPSEEEPADAEEETAADSPAEEEAESEKTDDKESNDEEDDDGLTPAAKKALNLPGYDTDDPPKFENLLVAINLVRAGNSLKDKAVKTELQDYYDRLDENERAVLILFLKELAKITTRAIEGDEAHDPSDPSTYFNITKRKEEQARDKQKAKEAEQGEEPSPQSQELQTSKQVGIEDTSPPIKVNEVQDISNIKKIIKLINS